MKLIATKGAPDIPLELLEAQEAGRLILFCGAGVSYPAGLPSFKRLVELVYADLPAVPSEEEKVALKSGLYDRALNLLEQRIQAGDHAGPNQVRRVIISALKLDSGTNIDTHKAILELSKDSDGRPRLVTTNVDIAFKLAATSASIHSAPTLPVPKPHRWHSIVHLHGIIDNVIDPDGQHLVFTSGDFGTAYLTERWASKFVTELFGNFLVLFVGYSINDPVIRYMTDAISSELRIGYSGFNRPYVISHAAPAKREQETESWRAKGVEPILYSNAHTNLHRTLKVWAANSRAGLSGKARIIREKAVIAPLPPYEQDEAVRQVVDTLRERTTPNYDEITGFPAKVFRKLSSPAAPIDWLPVLAGEGLLSIAKSADRLHAVHFNPVEANLLTPNPITLELWNWLLLHLETDELIRWVIDNGVCLHPKFKELVASHLERTPPAKPYLTFWRILTSGYVLCDPTRRHSEYAHTSELDPEGGDLAMRRFVDLLVPYYELKKSFTWPAGMFNDCDNDEPRSPYDASVVIGLSEWVYGEIERLASYPTRFVELLLPATNGLHRALEFWAFVGKADNRSDRSYWDLISVSRHEQNNRLNNWTILIELCRDLWESAWEQNRPFALAVLEIWKCGRFPSFRRLVFHAYTVKPVVKPKAALDYLLEDGAWWLWSTETYREKFRLLASLAKQLAVAEATKLLEVVLSGPPRDMFRPDLSPDEWKERSDRETWLLLAKLQDFGLELNERSRVRLGDITQNYPSWGLQQDEKDEFLHWSESGSGHETDMTVGALFQRSVAEMIQLLSEPNERFGKGRIDLFRAGSKENPSKCSSLLQQLADANDWNPSIWRAGLVGLADSDDPAWQRVSAMLAKAPVELFANEAWAVAWWIKKASAKVEPRTAQEEPFWQIADLLLDGAPRDTDLGDSSDLVSKAINNPVGIFTETLINRFTSYKLEAASGIPNSQILACVNKVVAGEGNSFVLGRVILASRLPYFFVVDPEWTKANLLPVMDWNTSDEAVAMWQGYLWVPRIYADLALALKKHLLLAVEKSEDLHDHADRLHQIFVLVCLQYPDLYTATQQHEALISIGATGLENVSAFLARSVRGDEVDADMYWEEQLRPFIRRAWPKSAEMMSAKSSLNLALTTIALDRKFPDAVGIFLPFIKPFADLTRLLNRLSETQLVEKHPDQVLDLLGAVFSREYQRPAESMRAILARLLVVRPNLRDDSRYRTMEDFLLERE